MSDKDIKCKIEIWIEKDHLTRSSSQKSEVQMYRSVGQVSAHALPIQILSHPSNICLPRAWLISSTYRLCCHLPKVWYWQFVNAISTKQVSLRIDQVSSFADVNQPQWFTLGNPSMKTTTTSSCSINVPQICLWVLCACAHVHAFEYRHLHLCSQAHAWFNVHISRNKLCAAACSQSHVLVIVWSMRNTWHQVFRMGVGVDASICY